MQQQELMRGFAAHKLLAAVKEKRKKEKYLDDPGDRRARLKFQMRSAGLRAEVGGWKNRNQSSQCIMFMTLCCTGEDESVGHVLVKCKAYREGRAQLWALLKTKNSLPQETG